MNTFEHLLAMWVSFLAGVGVWNFLMRVTEKRPPVYRRCVDFKGFKYEILSDDAIDDVSCKHVVVLRAQFGRHLTFIRDKEDFENGTVIGYKGKKVKKFTIIN